MSWRDKLSPRFRELLKEDIERAELLLELIRLLDEREKPPPPRVTTGLFNVHLFERPNPYWSDIPVPM